MCFLVHPATLCLLTSRMPIRFLDLFAGAGGLSEGFIQTGYTPVAHVEMDKAACNTLRTRAAFHYLCKHGRKDIYIQYLNGKISRAELYAAVPKRELDAIIEKPIGAETNPEIFDAIDALKGDKPIDLILGGPPCQAYSLVGRSRVGAAIKEDKRNYLFKYYVQFLERFKPKYFVFENVTGLCSAKDEHGNKFFQQVIEAFRTAGYNAYPHTVKAENHGIPQKRHRVIIVGCRADATNGGDIDIRARGACPVSVGEILSDLQFLHAGEGEIRCDGRSNHRPSDWLRAAHIADDDCPVTFHQARPVWEHDKAIYRLAVQMWKNGRQRFNYALDLPKEQQTHKNIKSFTDRFKVVDGTMHAAHTVVAHLQKDGHYYIHPDIEQNRSLTPREAARLQTFPDNYFFESATERDGRGAAFRQIGNAVPVALARIIAEELKPRFGKKRYTRP